MIAARDQYAQDPVERRIARMCERLARENRCLLALLVAGRSLSQANALLRALPEMPAGESAGTAVFRYR